MIILLYTCENKCRRWWRY